METPYTPQNVSFILGVTEKTVYKLLNKGEIPGRQIGGRWFIERETFHRFLATPQKPKREVMRSVDRHNLL